MSCGVKIDVLVVALFVSVNYVVKAHCVVKTCLDMSCSVRSGTVKVRKSYRKGLYTALEVRADGCYENTEHIFGCRLNSYNRIRSHHIRSYVESSARAEGGHVGSVSLNYLLNRLNELILGVYGHFKSFCRLLHTLCVEVGTEGNYSAVLSGIRLKSFKAGLRILEYAGALVKRYSVLRGKSSVVPLSVLVIRNKAVVGLHIAEAERSPVNIFLFHNYLHLLSYHMPFGLWHGGIYFL